jgi:hypothetical protein
MPRFYFHVHEIDGSTLDEEGRELPDLEKARSEALRGVRSILSAEVAAGRLDLRGRIDIADASGDVAFTIRFRDALQLELRSPSQDAP